MFRVSYWTRTWWSGVDNKKVKERKRLIFLGLRRKPIKSLTWGLRSPSRKMNSESLCAPGDQPEKEREGERERKSKTRGPKL